MFTITCYWCGEETEDFLECDNCMELCCTDCMENGLCPSCTNEISNQPDASDE